MKINELTKFALTLGLLPFIPAFILYKHSLYDYVIIVLAVFLGLACLCLISKKFAAWLKSLFKKIGNFLGKYISVFVLAIVYIIAVLPTGVLMKIVKRDRLKLKKPDCTSYWIKYDENKSDYEYQF